MKKERISTALGFKNELYNYVSIVLPAIDLFIIVLVAITSENPWITTPLNICFPILGVSSVKLAEKTNSKVSVYIALSLMPFILGVMTYYAGASSPTWVQSLPIITALFFLLNERWLQFLLAALCVAFIALVKSFLNHDVNEILGIVLGIAAFTAIIERSFSYLFKQQKKIEVQKEVIENKSLEITDSIKYAQRIQASIFPTEKMVKQNFPESFIFYKPKDIVAGDFYWMDSVKDLQFIAAADCTGHGVPGAIVSVVCSNALNQAVNELATSNTGKILDKTTELVLKSFMRSENEIKDGMDISLFCIDKKSGEFTWSGANNPLWYYSNGVLKEIKADKQPVGNFFNPKPFITNKVELKSGDIIFMFTDGFADQFGGPKGKKFKYKQIKELLSSCCEKDMRAIYSELELQFSNWKGSLEQVDDVCFIGIKL